MWKPSIRFHSTPDLQNVDTSHDFGQIHSDYYTVELSILNIDTSDTALSEVSNTENENTLLCYIADHLDTTQNNLCQQA